MNGTPQTMAFTEQMVMLLAPPRHGESTSYTLVALLGPNGGGTVWYGKEGYEQYSKLACLSPAVCVQNGPLPAKLLVELAPIECTHPGDRQVNDTLLSWFWVIDRVAAAGAPCGNVSLMQSCQTASFKEFFGITERRMARRYWSRIRTLPTQSDCAMQR